MTTYIFTYAILSILAISVARHRLETPITWLIFLFLLIFIGTRYYTGCDFGSYVVRFGYADPTRSLQEVLEYTEPGFELLLHSIKTNNLDFIWLNMACALLFLIGAYKFIKNHPTPITLWAIMLPIPVIQLAMSGVRQAVATGFLMFALHTFMQRQRLMTAALILIGSTFHQSLIMFLPLALVAGREFSTKRIILALMVLGPAAAVLLSDRFEVYQARYIDGDIDSKGGAIRLAFFAISALGFEIYKSKIKEKFPKQFVMMRIFSLITIMLIPAVFFSSMLVHRVGFYIAPVQLFTLAILPMVVPKSQESTARIICLMIYATYLATWFSLSHHADVCYTPYESYLFMNTGS